MNRYEEFLFFGLIYLMLVLIPCHVFLKVEIVDLYTRQYNISLNVKQKIVDHLGFLFKIIYARYFSAWATEEGFVKRLEKPESIESIIIGVVMVIIGNFSPVYSFLFAEDVYDIIIYSFWLVVSLLTVLHLKLFWRRLKMLHHHFEAATYDVN